MISAIRRRLVTLVRTTAEFRRFKSARPDRLFVGTAIATGHIDHVVVQSDATVSVEGWTPDLAAFRDALTLNIAGEKHKPAHAYRLQRPDVTVPVPSGFPFTGAIVEWTVDAEHGGQDATLEGNGAVVASFVLPAIVVPPYEGLRTDARVLGRENIYGSGPPSRHVSGEVVALATALPPPILDFGCGAGALLRELRAAGIEAYGLELDTPRIRDYLIEEVKPWVTLYNGALPAPFADGQFSSVSCSEVLEHIPDPGAVVRELARLAKRRMLITVPDMSAIPRGFPHGVVPWHLLEATHVNFFTQHSLEALLSASAARVETARIGVVRCDRLQYFTSLAALVDR